MLKKKTHPHGLTELLNTQGVVHPFMTVIPTQRLRHYMVLPDVVEEDFCRIEREYVARDRLAHHGLHYRRKILLYGPPGCGKAMGAERLAWNTGLRLVKVRFDSMVFLGETTTNLQQVLEASITPCLLFIDECDAIAKAPVYENGGTKHVVNTFLQLIDEYESLNGLLVAAINLNGFVDETVHKRFDDVILIPKPTALEIEAILKQTLSCIEIGLVNWEEIVQRLSKLSVAEIVKIAQDAAKRFVLDQQQLAFEKHLEASIKKFMIVK